MRKFRRNGICQLLSFLAAMMFVVSSTPVTVFAQEPARSDDVQSMALSKNKPVMYIAAAPKKTKSTAGSGAVKSTTKINYEPIKYFVAGKRIRILAEVTDPNGIKLVRCYFKAKEQADFVFVTMTPGSDTYTAILPAVAKNATSIDYLFLVVNKKNQVVKTQPFSVNIDAVQPTPPWQDVAMEGDLKVSTELAQAPAVLEGFSDSIVMDVVKSAARFGFVVGGIYTASQIAAAGGAKGAAASAKSAGTVTTTATTKEATTKEAATKKEAAKKEETTKEETTKETTTNNAWIAKVKQFFTPTEAAKSAETVTTMEAAKSAETMTTMEAAKEATPTDAGKTTSTGMSTGAKTGITAGVLVAAGATVAGVVGVAAALGGGGGGSSSSGGTTGGSSTSNCNYQFSYSEHYETYQFSRLATPGCSRCTYFDDYTTYDANKQFKDDYIITSSGIRTYTCTYPCSLSTINQNRTNTLINFCW